MSGFRKKYLSVENEVAVHPELPHDRAVPEPLPERKSEDGSHDYYLSVGFEPGSPAAGRKYREMIRAESAGYTFRSILLITILGGILGGIFAVPAVFLRGFLSWIQIFMLVAFGPFAEETLKQSGMIFQLEKLPGSVRYDWQFFLAGALGGLVFSILENLLYQHVYLSGLPPDRLAMVMSFRWVICGAMHISCPLISAMGLRRVWRRSLADGIPCQVSQAFPWFFAAMAVHGCYNLAALLWFEQYFK